MIPVLTCHGNRNPFPGPRRRRRGLGAVLSLAGKRMIGLAAILGGILIIILGVTKPNPFEDTRSATAPSSRPSRASARSAATSASPASTSARSARSGARATTRSSSWSSTEGLPRPRRCARRRCDRTRSSRARSFIDLAPGSPSAAARSTTGETIPLEQTEQLRDPRRGAARSCAPRSARASRTSQRPARRRCEARRSRGSSGR